MKGHLPNFLLPVWLRDESASYLLMRCLSAKPVTLDPFFAAAVCCGVLSFARAT
jgi:hypothetical protein